MGFYSVISEMRKTSPPMIEGVISIIGGEAKI